MVVVVGGDVKKGIGSDVFFCACFWLKIDGMLDDDGQLWNITKSVVVNHVGRRNTEDS